MPRRLDPIWQVDLAAQTATCGLGMVAFAQRPSGELVATTAQTVFDRHDIDARQAVIASALRRAAREIPTLH